MEINASDQPSGKGRRTTVRALSVASRCFRRPIGLAYVLPASHSNPAPTPLGIRVYLSRF